MNARILLAAGLSLAFATCAFAQDAAPAASASPTADAAAPAAASQKADMKKPAAKHHAKHHARAHVAGDPTHIDHSDDHMIVTPPESKVTLPAASQ